MSGVQTCNVLVTTALMARNRLSAGENGKTCEGHAGGLQNI